jgi:ribosomal-protein-serine acetyltransferase
MYFHQVDDDTTLSTVEMGDAHELFALVDSSRMYLREWLPWVDANVSIAETAAFIEAAQRQDSRGEGFQCCIRYRGKIVGIIGLNRLDRFHKQVEIGYWLAEECQGRGIMTACCRTLIDFVFPSPALQTVPAS